MAVVAPAHAATTSVVCDSAWTGRTVDANVVVPAGTWCQLHEVTVSGNVTVQSGATLHAYGKSAIAGNIFSDGGAVSVHDSSVGGNLTVLNAPYAMVFGGRVAGNTRIDGATGPVELCVGAGLTAAQRDQSVCGGLSQFGSEGRFGNVTITNSGNLVVFGGNTVTKNLACWGNAKGVTNAGLPNMVLGKASGQCVGA